MMRSILLDLLAGVSGGVAAFVFWEVSVSVWNRIKRKGS